MSFLTELNDSIPRFNVNWSEVHGRLFTKRGWQKNISVGIFASLSYLIYTKSGLDKIIESFFHRLFDIIPIINVLWQIDAVKVGVVAIVIFVIRDLLD